MGIVEDELKEVRVCCESQIPGSKVVAAVHQLVRVEIQKSDFKTIACCFMFPAQYPHQPILLELKSKTISQKLLDGLTKVAENESKKILGKPQILFVVKLIDKFIEENPLCCCSEEISKVKSLMGPDDSVKLSQKNSSINFTIKKESYYLVVRVTIPHNYPKDKVDVKLVDCNFPRVFRVWFVECCL